VRQTVQRVAGTLYLLDAKTEDSEGVLPLPEWTWLALLEHQERQAEERTAQRTSGRRTGSCFRRSAAPR
jgi:hypothetical protein